MLRQLIRQQCFDIGVSIIMPLDVNHYTCGQQRPRRDGDNV